MDMECSQNDMKKQALMQLLRKVQKLALEMGMGEQGESPLGEDGLQNVKGNENEMQDAMQMGEVDVAAEGGGGEKELEEMLPGEEEDDLGSKVKAFFAERSSVLPGKKAAMMGMSNSPQMLKKAMKKMG
jgi:hypothetical protein